jgi:acetolactate synthase II small subunit
MTVEGERSDESLQNQLAKLYDCLDVQVTPCR